MSLSSATRLARGGFGQSFHVARSLQSIAATSRSMMLGEDSGRTIPGWMMGKTQGASLWAPKLGAYEIRSLGAGVGKSLDGLDFSGVERENGGRAPIVGLSHVPPCFRLPAGMYRSYWSV